MKKFASIALILILFSGVCIILFSKSDDQFVEIDGGTYRIGAKDNPGNPLRYVKLESYEISKTEVTNEQFAAFVKATGYVTTAEKYQNAMTFRVGLEEFEWIEDKTANWRYPFGKSMGGIEHKQDHPVTCISFKDALAYCEWAHERLPTLAEWEVASRCGSRTRYFWGQDEKRLPEFANTWINDDHLAVPRKDRHLFTSPVASYDANPWGLYDLYGNVFEFCADKTPYFESVKTIACARGGSWWCSLNSCSYFNSEDIGRIDRFASFSNHGFRTVRIK